MTDDERLKIKKKNEARTREISEMIDEGGLGAEKYYKIIKKSSTEDEEKSIKKDEENDKK